VDRDHDPPAEGAASFHTTRWTIVMKAQGGQAALAELCRLYWYPFYIFARRRGHSPDDAQDLTQSFFLQGMDLSLLFLQRQGLAGRPRYAGPPDLPFAGLQSALGSLPSVALSSAGASWVCSPGV